MYQANQAKKDQQAAMGAAGQYPNAFGQIPEFEPVDYTPLYESDPGYETAVRQVIDGNRRNVGAASVLTGKINQSISKQAKARIEGYDPSFFGNLATIYNTRNATSAGYLPYSDALAMTADQTRLAGDLGNAGGASPQIAADLGLKRTQLMTETGPNLQALVTNILNQVDPISRHATPQDYLIRPDQAVPWMINENQFGATFDFNQNMQMAAISGMADPAQAGALNMQMFQAGLGGGSGGGGGGSGSGVNYAQIAQALGSAYGAYAGSGGGGATTYNMNSGPAASQQSYYNPSTQSYYNPNLTGGTNISQRPAGV